MRACLFVYLPACIHFNTDLTVYIHLYIDHACLSAYVCLFACLYACLIICLFCCLYAFQHLSDLLHPMSVYRLHIYLYACLPICLFTSHCAYLFVCLPVGLSASLYASPTPSPQNHTIKIQITPFCFIKHMITFICYHNMLSGVPPHHPPSNPSITDSVTQQHKYAPSHWVQQGCNITHLKDVTSLFSRM